jgi:hypothetical protein
VDKGGEGRKPLRRNFGRLRIQSGAMDRQSLGFSWLRGAPKFWGCAERKSFSELRGVLAFYGNFGRIYQKYNSRIVPWSSLGYFRAMEKKRK